MRLGDAHWFSELTLNKALICGVTGQDGAYLAKSLLDRGYRVWGTSRDAQAASLKNLQALGIAGSVELRSLVQTDFRSALTTIASVGPAEIYFLSGQSSVGLSFDLPVETMESVALGVLNLLEVVRFLGKPVRIFHASSSESFGDTGRGRANETTPFKPHSPYGIAKASAHWLVNNYREAYGLYCCNGILFNHESPLRPGRFVTKKIVAAACRVKRGSAERLTIGRLDISRDWGWAPDYVDAMWRALQTPKPSDYVIATGHGHTLQDFVEAVFGELDLAWRDYVDVDPQLYRPLDITQSVGDPAKAMTELGWQSKTSFDQLVARLVSAEFDGAS
jgi:GDPmannose 4,6-dehydratase